MSEYISKLNGLDLESISPDHLTKVKLSLPIASRIKLVPALYNPDSVKISPEFSGIIYVLSLNVFYIDHDIEKGSSIKKMIISENGELISQWPNGFFSTDIEEIFD